MPVISPAEAEARAEGYRASHVRPDCSTQPPPGESSIPRITTHRASDQIDLLHQRLAELHSTEPPESPPTLAHQEDVYSPTSVGSSIKP